jgi:hypothetical protein
VEDDLDGIILALGGDPKVLAGRHVKPAASNVPIREY